MNTRRVLTVVKMEIKRLFRDPLVMIFTVLLVPMLILLFGLLMGDNYGWSPDYTIFEIMLPGLLAYSATLTIYDVAASVAGERELGIQKRINATPLTTSEYVASQLIAYTIKPLIQLVLGLGLAYLVGYRPLANFAGYLLIVLFMVILTFCSVGFGLITASFSKTAAAAGGLAFLFIVPQQIFGSFIPPVFLGVQNLAWALPSYYATDGFGLILAGVSLMDERIWIRLGILCAISLVIYVIGTFLYEKQKRN